MAGRRRRFGRVRQLPSKRWQARYPGPDGVLRTAPETFARKGDAERWLVDKESEVRRGLWIDPAAGIVTVAEWSDRWLSSVRPALKVKTVASYESLLRSTIGPTFGAVPVSAVRPIMVGEWVAALTKRGLSPSRVRQSYVVLSLVLDAAVDNDMILASPCRRVRLPRLPQSEPRILIPAEVERLVAAATPPHDLLIELLAYAGLRIGEAFALRRSCIDLAAATVTIAESLAEVSGRLTFVDPKNHQRRTLALPGFVVARLAEHLADLADDSPDALLFTGRTGRPLHYSPWRRDRFDPARAAAGLPDVTPHDLRATHATWVADSHGVMAAAQRLGHSNASVTTRHYARAVEGRDADIAERLNDEVKRARQDEDEPEGARKGHDEESDEGKKND